jgi:hypothetical protein
MKLQLFVSVLAAVLIVTLLMYFGWHHEAIAISR